MKKRIMILTMVVCVLLMLGSASVMAADDNTSIGIPGTGVTPSDAGVYSDVAPKEWYYNYVTFASNHNIFQGYPDGTFCPNKNMTRGEVVRVLYTLEGEPEVTPTERFSDVPLKEWYAEEVEWAASINVVAGYPDGTFQPQLEVSRQDFVSMLYRYATYKGYDTTGRAELNFPDADTTNLYAVDPFAWAIDSEIISGTVEADGIYLRPAANTTRAQVAKMLSVFAVEFEKLGATTGVVFFAEEVTITVGNSRLIQYAVQPDNSAYSELVWTSSDESVVSVSRGIVTGVGAGEATVTATTFDGNTASFKVTVTDTPLDPYGDVADAVELKANAGQWNENPMFLFAESSGDWEFLYGVAVDYATGSVYLVSDSYHTVDGYEIYAELLTQKGTSECSCIIYVYDELEAVIWRGMASFDAKSWTDESAVALSSFSCDEPAMATDQMKTYLTDSLNDDIHFLVSNMDSFFEDLGVKSTAKDFGFVNY